MPPFIEKMPRAVDARLHIVKPSEEEVRIQVATDMADKERFEERWLVVTDQRLLLFRESDQEDVVQMPMDNVAGARVEPLVAVDVWRWSTNRGSPLTCTTPILWLPSSPRWPRESSSSPRVRA